MAEQTERQRQSARRRELRERGALGELTDEERAELAELVRAALRESRTVLGARLTR